MRGNVMDMAIGIILGAAFGKIVSSFVGDVLMRLWGCSWADELLQPLRALAGGTYASLAAAKEAGARR